MLSSAMSKTKPESVDSFLEKAENFPENVEIYKSLVNAQKKFIEQQKLLIDWLTGQIVNSGNSPSTPKSFPKNYRKLLMDRPTLLWIAGILLALISIASLIVYFSVTYNFNRSGSVAPSTGHDDDLGDGIQVIKRQEWLAQPPLNVTKLAHPLQKVRILHTGGTNCKDYQTCANKVLALQGWQVASQGMPDLAYNYMIGGDGNVYVGRGPGVANEWMPSAIDIGFIGNFLGPYDKMTDKMDEAGRRLVVWLRREGHITPDYIVIAQNQTYNTQSPGENIYKRIEWLARDPLYVTHFTHPPKMVRILHTAGVFCTDYQMCANKILGLQGSHVAQMGMPDIAYNYLVGGDGGVYIGRGADVQSNGRNDSIDIAYVGNYLAPFDKLSDKMEESGKKLITRLLERGKITGDYIIVAHNQTENTTSPGENDWNALEPLKITKLPNPVKIVRIMHTGGSNCFTKEICAFKVKRLQEWMIGTKGMPDLSYNYMIGGDGNVYIGRGPDVENENRPDTIDIGYVGNYLTPYDKMTDKMEEAGKRLIAMLSKHGYVTKDYIVVAHNQTIATQSPGQNIYEKVVKWPHYNSGLYFS